MILLDTSYWIFLLNKKHSIKHDDLNKIVVCNPVIQEILQGIKDDHLFQEIKQSILSFPLVSDPVRTDLYIHAAQIYRLGRRKGYTIRSSVDCLIAAIAIENDIPVLHKDRDYDIISEFTSLKIVCSL